MRSCRLATLRPSDDGDDRHYGARPVGQEHQTGSHTKVVSECDPWINTTICRSDASRKKS